jgi:hypothetical protein
MKRLVYCPRCCRVTTHILVFGIFVNVFICKFCGHRIIQTGELEEEEEEEQKEE